MSRSRYRIVDDSHAYFFTCTTVGWLPVFTRPEAAQIVLDSWRFMQANGRLRIYGYVILENHTHFVSSGPDLANEIGDFKSYTARKILDFLKTRNDCYLLRQLQHFMTRSRSDREHQLWQEGSHPQQIEGDAMMHQKLEYAHMNPVKRGYVDDPLHWRYSSARNYAGLEGLIPVVTDW